MGMRVPAGFSMMEGESLKWHGRMSWKANWLLILLGLLTIWFFVGVIFFIIAALRVISSEYLVTNKRIYVKYGIIRRTVFELKNEWITSYIVRQGLVGRILNFGDIVVSTPGYYSGVIVILGISDPMHLKTLLENILQEAKKVKEIEASLKKFEEEYEMGRLSKEKYDELKRKYEEELRKHL
jgi:uncharacterized membrane protein YdbT with pleckstrin-like domain